MKKQDLLKEIEERREHFLLAIDGLSDEEVKARQEEHGYNEIIEAKKNPILKLLFFLLFVPILAADISGTPIEIYSFVHATTVSLIRKVK